MARVTDCAVTRNIHNKSLSEQNIFMSNEIDFDEILSKYRSDPYDYVDITATHTGVVNFQVEKGVEVDAPGGEWMHIPGTALYEITRERNPKVVSAPINGIVSELHGALEGQFVEAG
jgi:hypothetical protein